MTHDGTNQDHPWYTFDAVSGDMIGLNLSHDIVQGGFLWLYRVNDDNAEVGDSTGNGALTNAANSAGGNGNVVQTIDFSVTDTGQYAVQVDSWLGGSGDYVLRISGATGPIVGAVPEPASLAVFGVLTMVATGTRRRRK